MKMQINTDFFRHGLTRINTVEMYISLWPLCSLWLKTKNLYSVAEFC
jgi:hypothetical protein